MADREEVNVAPRSQFEHEIQVDRLRDSICTTPEGTYSTQEVAQYDPRVLEYRDEHLTRMFKEAADESDLDQIPDTDRLQAHLLNLPVGFPLPDATYLNGDGKWCVDWEATDSDKAVYTCHASKNLLLVIVDLADGRYLRLPCDLSADDPLRYLRLGLTEVFENEQGSSGFEQLAQSVKQWFQLVHAMLNRLQERVSWNTQLSTEVRFAADEEVLTRFVFQLSHLRSGKVKKQALHVFPNPKTGRHELSVYLLSSLNPETMWDDMPRLGNRKPGDTAKGYGQFTGTDARKFEDRFDVEVNHNPNPGHSDVIGWSDEEEVRMEQTIKFAKIMVPVLRPKEV